MAFRFFTSPLLRGLLKSVFALLTVCASTFFASERSDAQEGIPTSRAEQESTKQFESSIRPILIERCQKCHGADKQWGSLRLDSREHLLKGGDSGPAIVPGKPEDSLLIKAIRHEEESLQMPPKEPKLSDKQIAEFVIWIKQGAVFPDQPSSKKTRHRDPGHWSFQPIPHRDIPAASNSVWATSPIDSFIENKLVAAKMAPTTQASKRTLVRRATFDLTGLPPTPTEILDFLADDRPDAFERLIDRLLASPSYGERWGRHWLDVARYADSNGLDENVAHGNAWRYRDYVIDSFNEDRPYDAFIVEQIAGDLLSATSDSQKNRQLIATGFLALGPKVLAEVDEAKMQMDIVDEQIDTVGRAVLALTLGCARCHDHKFDPIETSDYYGLAGIFKSTKTMEHFKKVARWYENTLPSPEAIALKKEFDDRLAEKQAAIKAFIDQADAAVKASLKEGESPPAKLEDKYPDETKAKLKQLRDEMAQFQKNAPELPSAMGATEDKVADVAIHVRGNPLKLGSVVPRRVPVVFSTTTKAEFHTSQSGRMELANWLISPTHPLTSRVFVNRVWRWHFGKGIVRSTDNFGLLGDTPSHPELLDWLTRRFIDQGWSLKKLHRDLMLSSTYRLDSHTPDATVHEQDPANILFGRAEVRRLEAEAVRDSLIAVGDRLNDAMHGSLLTVKNRAYFFDHTSKDLTDYSSHRRSLYLPVVRNNLYDVFSLLDFPDAAIPNGDRTTTTVAPQALLMMNSDFVSECSSNLAERLLQNPSLTDAMRIRVAYSTTFGREPTQSEIENNIRFLSELETAASDLDSEKSKVQRRAWDAFCQVLLCSNEFIYVR